MCHDNCYLKHSHKWLKTEETKRYIRILNQLNPRECNTMQKAFSTQSQTLRHITQSRGDQIRPFLQLPRQKITHRKSNTFRTTKIVVRDWDDEGKRKEDEHLALHDVGRSFRRSFNSSELSWRPYGNSSNNFKSFKSQVQQQKRSYKSQCVHTTTVATRAGEPQLRQLGGRDSYEEEEAFGETNPAFRGVLDGFTPSIVTLLPSLPQNCKHDQHFPYAA